ncbi:MAG: hypothetical protein GXP56_00035 [Deltaproteobacteria bacterium]|nr:hypothetical protein [Deltaproteobacteria bacterium]
MQHKSIIFFTGLLVFLNTFYGCAGLQKEPVTKNYFDLNLELPFPNGAEINKGRTLLVKEFFISPDFDSYSFIYRIGKNKYETDYYNEFLSYPAKLITAKIMESLFATPCFKPAQTDMRQDIDYRLSGKITMLYGNFQDRNNPGAIVAIRLSLEKRATNTFQAVFGKTYLSKEPILSATPAQLVSGWNKGLTKIVAQFISDFHNTQK